MIQRVSTQGWTSMPTWLIFTTLICMTLLALAPVSTVADTHDQADWHYTYRPSDSLQAVGKRLLNNQHTWSDIVRYNQIDNVAGLQPGSIIKVPINWLKFQPKPASTLSVSGNVLVKKGRAQQFSRLKANTAINVSDEIVTRKGRALIKFADSSILIIEEDTHVTFNKLTHYGETGMVDTRIRLKRGGVSADVSPLVKGSRYEISTPSAVAAVRGTQFRLQTDAQGTRIEVTEGEVELTHAHGKKKIEAGQGASVSAQSALVTTKALNEAPSRQFDSAVLDDLPATLNWKSQIEAAAYRFQLRKDSKHGQLVRSSEHRKPSVSLDQLQNGTYSLAMRSIDKQGFQGIDDTANISIQIASDIPALLTPSGDSIASKETTLFSWRLKDSHTLSKLELSKDANFSNLAHTQAFSSETKTKLDPSISPGIYYWRVVALSEDSSESESDVRKISLRGTMDTATILSVNYIKNQVGLFWNNVEDADGYILQVSETSSFRNILREESIAKASAFLKLAAGKKYYARVKGVATELYQSDYGPSKELHIKK